VATGRQPASGQWSHHNEAVVAEGNITHRHRAAMSANHIESEKQKENAIQIGHDALLGLEEAGLEYIDSPY
jgi:hypothetical protein